MESQAWVSAVRHKQSANTRPSKMKLPPGARKVTDFEDRVFCLCCKIPKGRVTTYGQLAMALASSARAVGQAMRRNPFAPTVPCHRVVSADMKIGGYFGSTASQSSCVKKKRQLLLDEGVEFFDEDTISKQSFFSFDPRHQGNTVKSVKGTAVKSGAKKARQFASK